MVVRPDGSENEKPVFDIDRGKRITLFCCNISLPSHLLEIKATTSPFLFLAVDLPPPPLFQDAVEKNIIPQVGIHTVFAKYDGVKTQVRSIHNTKYDCPGHNLALRNRGVNCVGSIVNNFRHILSFITRGLRRTTLSKRKIQPS